MKKYILILVAIASLQSVAMAQKQVGAEVNVQKFEYDADSVTLNINFDFKELTVGANESVVVAALLMECGNGVIMVSTFISSLTSRIAYNL